MGTVTAKTTTIGDITYTAQTMDAIRSLYVQPRLIALCGEQLFALMMSVAGMGHDEGGDIGMKERIATLVENPKVLSSMLVGMSKSAADPDGPFKGDGLNEICRDLFEGVTCSEYRVGTARVPGGPVLSEAHYAEHFRGKTMEMLKLAWWVASINFFDFTGASD